MNKEVLVNKTMDFEDLNRDDCIEVIKELNEMMKLLNDKGLLYSSWGGLLDQDEGEPGRLNRGYDYSPHPLSYDDAKIPWFLYWEIAWVYLHSGLKPGRTVLDMGGCSSLFSFFLAHKGCSVYAVDLNDSLVKNAETVADKMNWKMHPTCLSMVDMQYEDNFFDYVFSICVFEHILFDDRVKIMKKVEKILKPKGKFCITIDYKNPDKEMNINSPEDVRKNFILPTSLSVLGNSDFHDNGKRYLFHPWFHSYSELFKRVYHNNLPLKAILNRGLANYTFGALFCQMS